MTTFIDQNNKLCCAIRQKDFSLLKREIAEQANKLSFYVVKDSEIFGYTISKNIPLSEIYLSDFYVVKFVFSEISTLHNEDNESILKKMMHNLKKEIKLTDGYFNIRIPSHIVDLIKAYNEEFSNFYFCGGTVEEYTYGKNVTLDIKEGMNFFFCDNNYITKNKEALLEITYKSFEAYQGQYHISPATDSLAGVIYKNWIASEFVNLLSDTVLVAEYQGEPCGFVTIEEGESYVEGKLAAVSSKFRGLGTYRNMIAYLINYACNKNKAFLSSTQFDNYTVQGAWSGLGMRPFYSIYNMHIDNRQRDCENKKC